MILKVQQTEEFTWVENFLSAGTTSKHAWRSCYAEKKLVPSPTPSNSSIFPLLKDAIRTSGIKHHLKNSVMNVQTP